MRSIVEVTTAATATALTTLARVKSELGIANAASDAVLTSKIAEASSDIAAVLNFVPQRETVTETFWDVGSREYLALQRLPVTAIASVTIDDDDPLESDEYRLDAEAGLLYQLDDDGYSVGWCASKQIVVAYTAGYALPGQPGRNLPEAIEAAAVELVQDFWFARGRDPTAMEEEIPGVMRVRRWVGTVATAGGDVAAALPPNVMAKLASFIKART